MYLFPANLTNLQQLVLFTVAMVTGLISIYAFNMWILTLLSVRGRNKLAAPPILETWPKVSVHLPLFNEETVAGRLLDACVKLDYPADKLEIIVMDDSNDGTTTRIAKSFEAKYPNLVRVIHRERRTGFKAGALEVAMRKSTGEFIALFDADYVPPADFLKKMIPHLYLDDRVAFAQSRWSYLDGQFSWIAKAMSLAIDVYAFVDQRARYVGNLLAHFSGTCGVFRRKAIEDAGGWSADTLAEDLDLSIRLHLKGWKYIYVPTVVCPGEIPPSFDNLRHQQYRWAKGYSECLRKHGGAILRSAQLNFFQKMEAILHLSTYFICPLTIIAIVVGLLYYSVFPPSFWLMGFWRYQVALITFLLSLVIYSAPLVASGVTLSEFSQVGVMKLRRILHLGYLGAIVYGLLFSNSRAVIEGLFSRTSYFYRTPKIGSIRVARD
ncbi:MAG: glycosyltransferase [Candidatus Bathyarchaeia archaeon]|jgi:cellulose synthase/poly-beta-1,6-N-acetylglucosamine synthase-like glycosyltransferase